MLSICRLKNRSWLGLRPPLDSPTPRRTLEFFSICLSSTGSGASRTESPRGDPSLGCAHGFACEPARGPGGLKIEATCQAVDIEQFASEIKAGTNPAFHGFETDFAQAHAAARYELVLVESFSVDLKFGPAQLLDEEMPQRSRKISPACLARDSGGHDQCLPQSRRQWRHREIHDQSGGLRRAA